jgi:hypothetical protein
VAIRTFREPINTATYTLVGSNVSQFSCVERSVERVRVVVVDVGDSVPATGETQYVTFDDFYERNSDSVDIYMLAEGVDAAMIEGERS